MCLAIPGKVEELFQQDGLKMAKINVGGIRKSVCLQYTPEAVPGDYVLIHVGFALSIINEAEAQRTYQSLQMTDDLKDFAALQDQVSNEIR
jgi:hydrogenase expression/formation protein HypC